MLSNWLNALTYVFFALFGLYLLTYDAAVMAEKLARAKSRVSVRTIRILGFLSLVLGILLTLEALGIFGVK